MELAPGPIVLRRLSIVVLPPGAIVTCRVEWLGPWEAVEGTAREILLSVERGTR